MLSLQKTIAQSLLLLTVIPVVVACSKSKFTATQAPAVKPVEQTNNPRPTYPTNPTPTRPTYPTNPNPTYPTHPTPPANDCHDYNYEYSNNGPKTVHVWVVMDGSKSNEEERYKQLTGLIEMYESVIAREIPIHLGVITGHSAESYHSALRGNNFFKYANADLDILRFDHRAETRRNNFIRLRNKILNMRTDNSQGISDGGELLTANLMAVFRNNQYRHLMNMQNGDLLNILFIGDENDACTIGQVPSSAPLRGLPLYQGEQGLSSEQIARRRHCMVDRAGYSINMNVSDSGRGFSQTLAQELVNVGRSFRTHVSAFVYTGEGPIPSGGQNEIGRGIIDLLQAVSGNGVRTATFDLASLSASSNVSAADASTAVYAAGTSMMEGMNNSLYQRVQMRDQSGNAMEVRPEYIQSVTVDGRPVDYTIEQGGYVKLIRRCPQEGRQIRIRYCNNRR